MYEAIKQLHQYLTTEQLDRKTLQFNSLQLQNDFSFVRYLLFSSVAEIPLNDNSKSHSAVNPTATPQPTLNPQPKTMDTLPLIGYQVFVFLRRALWDH